MKTILQSKGNKLRFHSSFYWNVMFNRESTEWIYCMKAIISNIIQKYNCDKVKWSTHYTVQFSGIMIFPRTVGMPFWYINHTKWLFVWFSWIFNQKLILNCIENPKSRQNTWINIRIFDEIQSPQQAKKWQIPKTVL